MSKSLFTTRLIIWTHHQTFCEFNVFISNRNDDQNYKKIRFSFPVLIRPIKAEHQKSWIYYVVFFYIQRLLIKIWIFLSHVSPLLMIQTFYLAFKLVINIFEKEIRSLVELHLSKRTQGATVLIVRIGCQMVEACCLHFIFLLRGSWESVLL